MPGSQAFALTQVESVKQFQIKWDLLVPNSNGLFTAHVAVYLMGFRIVDGYIMFLSKLLTRHLAVLVVEFL